MKRLSFSIPSAKPQPARPQSVAAFDDAQNDTAVTKHLITEFDPSKPVPSKITIPPLQNQWKPKPKPPRRENETTAAWRRTPEETELQRKLKLKDDLQRLPVDQGLEEFKDVPVESFGAAVLGGYGWTQGMGIGKNAKEVNVVQFKGRAHREGLGFVAPPPSTSVNLDQFHDHLNHLQL